MLIQLYLILLTLGKLQQNIHITSYRKQLYNLSKNKNSVQSHVSFLNFFLSYRQGLSYCLRATNFKQYKFGFDSILFPLKQRYTSILILKELPTLNITPSFLISPLGAWGSKFDHKEKYKSVFFKTNSEFFFKPNLSKFNNNLSFSLYNWLGFVPFIFFFLFNFELTFFWSYLSIFNPGCFFLKKLNKNSNQHLILSEPNLNYIDCIDNFILFLFNLNVSSSFNLHSFESEDLFYNKFIKLSLKTQLASWVIYSKVFDKKIKKYDIFFIDCYYFNLFFLVLKWLSRSIKNTENIIGVLLIKLG